MTSVKTRKKLIEVALPLEAINVASAREKSIRHGHPSTLHLWWARRPLAAARAVIFSQMVDDPSSYVDTLLGEPTTRKMAERELKSRLKLWEVRVAEYKAATGNEAVAVPEPGPKPTLEDAAADIERKRLFQIIEELVKWESSTNEDVLNAARAEIWQSWRRACVDNIDHPRAREIFDRHKLPAFHDPFAGGGALPLEAQRLGLEAYATDLNPVAVLINKAMIEIPTKFSGLPPMNPVARKNPELIARQWEGAAGLAEDVRYYGQWMRDEAEKRIGHLYPKIEITAEMSVARPDLKNLVGKKLTVIAWIWARTVKSPNPAFANVDVPLASTFTLSTKPGKEAYVLPLVENGGYRFSVCVGKPKDAETAQNGTKLARANFKCLMSGSPISGDYIKAEGKAHRMSARLMAIVAEGVRGRVYISPTEADEKTAELAAPSWKPDGEIAARMTGGNCTPYGLTSWGHIFTARQLVALTTFSDLVGEARDEIAKDAIAANLPADATPLHADGTGAQAYGDAVSVYLAFAIDRMAMTGNSLVRWNAVGEKAQHCFGRQALPMLWDFGEPNFFGTATGSAVAATFYSYDPLMWMHQKIAGFAGQSDAATQSISTDKLVSTDPPYYDNIGYADLSDFFYVWMRRSLRPVFPDLFGTLAVPKAEELVATAYRHGGKEKAESFFLNGMTKAMHRLAEQAHEAFPVTIYYAFKQSETESAEGTVSTGWETFLEAVIRAGFGIFGTWPMRTEMRTRQIAMGTNALASSIVLVCRPREITATSATRREFLSALRKELPESLAHLQRGNIAPVDLAQASIGPGMAVYTRYEKVVDAEGTTLSVREALALINQTLDEVLAEQEGDFDPDTRWAVTWFEEYGFIDGEFGKADVLARAKVTAVAALAEAKIVVSKAGRVRLLKPAELDDDWNPKKDKLISIWEIVHHLIRVLEAGGEIAAGELIAKIGVQAEVARELAYRLYTICERKKRAGEALSYNALVQSWPEINRLAQSQPAPPMPAQADMFQGV